MGEQHVEWRQTGGQADGHMRADGARTGWTSGRADGRTSRGFKRPRTSFPTSLSSAQTTCLTAKQVCRALGSALGSWLGLHYYFFAPNSIFAIQAQHYCEVCARIVLAKSTERENDLVVQAVLVEDDDPEVFQEPAKKPKTSTKPYVEVPEPSDMHFVRCPESKRAPSPPKISEKYKSLDAKLLRMKKKNRWESAQERYSRMKQDKKNTW